jgi:hypothetical protein
MPATLTHGFQFRFVYVPINIPGDIGCTTKRVRVYAVSADLTSFASFWNGSVETSR